MTMTRQQAKEQACAAIDGQAERLIALGEDIFAHPELGYKEHRTAGLIAEEFAAMGLPFRSEIAITGLRTDLPGPAGGPLLAIMGELDSVLCPGHPQADPLTGAAHSCGHNAQLMMMLGVGHGLLGAGLCDRLGGRVTLMAVPAEEYVEIEYRERLRREGKIVFLGGKQEFIRLGELDDVDLAMMCHTTAPLSGKAIVLGGTSNGFVGKFIKFKGREAHAGGAPHAGVNVLNAAMLGLMAIHANRETFRDDDTIRVHPIITKGGDLVNIIPADVRMETYVRGKRMDGILDAARKVNRALEAGALAVGAEVEITELPGYLPRINNERMNQLFLANAAGLVGADTIAPPGHTTGSSDIGDVMHLMPSIHPYTGGAAGTGHSENYRIVDPHLAYIVPAKAMVMTAIDLLWEDAAEARAVVEAFEPVYTKESYLAMWEQLFKGE